MAKSKRNKAAEQTFGIDLDRLDEEWVEQPDLCKDYHDELADAKRDLATEEATLDVVKSEIARDIRAHPAEYGADKVTEPGVKELIVLQKKFKKQLAIVIEAQHRVDVLVGAVKAIEHRKKALENAVFLYGQNYFSSPRTRGEGGESMREAETKSARGRVRKMTREQLENDDED